MSQMTFSDYEYSLRKRKTKREEFLEIMEEIIPWDEWVEFVRPYYPDGRRGRPTKGIEKMLRMYLLQIWFNLSDEGVEDAIYDSYAFRKFMKMEQKVHTPLMESFRSMPAGAPRPHGNAAGGRESCVHGFSVLSGRSVPPRQSTACSFSQAF